MRSCRLASAITITLALLPGTALATGGDAWPTLAHDGGRSARSAGQGAITAAPSVAWKLPVGGALTDTQVAVADIDNDGDNDLVLVAAGRVAARRNDDTTIWASDNIGATRVIGVIDLDGQGPPEVIALGSSPQGVYILSAQTGKTLWYAPTTTTAADVITAPNPAGGQRLFLPQQLNALTAYQFANGFLSPAQNQLWQSATSPWSTDMVVADVDGDGKPELIRGHDRGFVAYDAATGAVRCDASNLIGGTNAPAYFPALSAADVDGDGRAEIVVYDYSYYYSEDAGVFVVKCAGNGPALAVQVLLSQQWITDITPGPGNNVNDKQILYLADGVANLDGQGALEMVYSLWDASSSTWTTFVRNAATGAMLDSRAGEVLEGIGDVDADGRPEVLLREATGIGALPKPFFSKLRAYDFTGAGLVDKGWALDEARVATIGGFRAGNVTVGAGVVAARQNVDGAADPAAEAYVFQKPANASPTDSRPGRLLAVHGADGVVLRKYDFPKHITGAVLALTSDVEKAGAPSEALVMLTDGGLRVLDTNFNEANKLLPGNHARFITVASLEGTNNLILAVDSSDGLIALDGKKLAGGLPVQAFRVEDIIQSESRGYLNAPGLVVPAPGGGARLVVRAHGTASYEEQSLAAIKADGTLAWQTDIGAGRQIPGFENFELMDDLDGDGVRDMFLTELAPDSSQELVVRKGADGAMLVSRPVADLFPPNGVYLQGHAAVDLNGDGKLDVVSALHGSWFVGIDVSKAGTMDPLQGFQAIFRTANGPNGQAMVGQLDADPELDLVRVASQNAFGAYERRSLLGVVEASYAPPTPAVAGTDANTAALMNRTGAPGMNDLVWSGMAGSALGAVARVDGQGMSEVWFDYLAGGMVYPKANPPATRAALHSPVAVDLDGDGSDEILVGADDGYLYALHGADGSPFFAVDLGAPVVHTIAADLDKDDKIEILCALADGTLVALDQTGGYDADPVMPPDGGGGSSASSASSASSGAGGGASSASSGAGGASTGSSASSGAGGSGGGGTGQTGGCGCRVESGDGSIPLGALGLGALAAVLVGRRRKGRG